MQILATIPGIIAQFVALTRSPQQAFLDVYLPVLILMSDYYRWMAPGLPDPSFSQSAILPIGILFLVREAAKWKLSIADVLVLGFAFCIGYSESLNAGYSEAQNLMFDMLSWVILPYILGKGMIAPHGLSATSAKRLVCLLFIMSLISVYEFKMGRTPWQLILARFFPGQGAGWVTTFRWGFTRIAGPYGHAILAGVILNNAYRLQRWLEWSQLWEPRFSKFPGLPLLKARIATLGELGGVIMTMVRGPWIGGMFAAVIAAIGRAKNRWRALGIIAAVAIVVGTPAVLAFKSYVAVGRAGAKTVAQESAAYRKELMENISIWRSNGVSGVGVETPGPKSRACPRSTTTTYYSL